MGSAQIKVGDIVLVQGDQKRVTWKMGRIVRLLKSSDGEARAATVQVAATGRQHTLIDRRIEKMYPLELAQNEGEQ